MRVEVETVTEVATGEVVVLLTVDDWRIVMEPEAASMLADRLKTEATFALVIGAEHGWGPAPKDPGYETGPG